MSQDANKDTEKQFRKQNIKNAIKFFALIGAIFAVGTVFTGEIVYQTKMKKYRDDAKDKSATEQVCVSANKSTEQSQPPTRLDCYGTGAILVMMGATALLQVGRNL